MRILLLITMALCGCNAATEADASIAAEGNSRFGKSFYLTRVGGHDYVMAILTPDANVFHDEEMEICGRCRHLRILNLNSLKIKGVGFKYLVGLPDLEVMSCSAADINDEALVYVRELTQLRELDLGGTRVTDAGISTLATLDELRSLLLYNCKIDGSGLSWLPQLAELKEIDLGGTDCDDRIIPVLLKCRGLTRISLWGTKVSAESITALKAAFPAADVFAIGLRAG